MTRIAVLLLLLILALLSVGQLASIKPGHATTADPTTLTIQPVVTCCNSGNPLMPPATFRVDVKLNLAAGEAMNGFDVRVNYTNPHSNGQVGAVQAWKVIYDNNIFASYSAAPSADCVDGIAQSNSICASDDSLMPGQIHFAEATVGTYSGPASGILFSIMFNVTGRNSSIFYFDRANLINPRDVSNPSIINPHFIQTITLSGGFGNNGIVAFFNYQTSKPDISPALLPTVPVNFDASQSLNANSSTIQIVSFAWDFGDSSQGTNSSNVSHAFALPGTYLVKLTVTDSNHKTGSLTWPVTIVPSLGTLLLDLVDSVGSVIHDSVLVQAFNSSSSTSPFLKQNVTQGNQALLQALVPGTYLIRFSASTVESSSKQETVVPGFTVRDIVVLSLIRITPPPDYSTIIFLGSTLGAIAIFSVALIVKRNRAERVRSKQPNRPKKTRP